MENNISPKRITFKISDDLHRRLKMKAASSGTTITALITECAERVVSQPDRTTEERAAYTVKPPPEE